MFRIVERGGQRVVKYGHSLVKGDAMLPAVALGLRAIPFEVNSLSERELPASNLI